MTARLDATATALDASAAPHPDSRRDLAAIFLLSLGVLLLEIATRIFSFSLWGTTSFASR